MKIKNNKVYLKKLGRSGGFSLLEVLLVVGIAAIIFTFSTPYTINFYRSQIIGDVEDGIFSALQSAKHKAVLQKNDSKFGVTMSEVANSYVLFQGSTYDSRVIEEDEVFSVVNEITFSGLTDIVFSKLSGLPSATGTIVISFGNISREILIEDSGLLSKVY